MLKDKDFNRDKSFTAAWTINHNLSHLLCFVSEEKDVIINTKTVKPDKQIVIKIAPIILCTFSCMCYIL